MPANNLQELTRVGRRASRRSLTFRPLSGMWSQLYGAELSRQGRAPRSSRPFRAAAIRLCPTLLSGRINADVQRRCDPGAACRGGKVRALGACAVLGARRSCPEVRRSLKQECPGYDAGIWIGLLAPAGTPAAIVEKLSVAANGAWPPRRFASAEAAGHRSAWRHAGRNCRLIAPTSKNGSPFSPRPFGK